MDVLGRSEYGSSLSDGERAPTPLLLRMLLPKIPSFAPDTSDIRKARLRWSFGKLHASLRVAKMWLVANDPANAWPWHGKSISDSVDHASPCRSGMLCHRKHGDIPVTQQTA